MEKKQGKNKHNNFLINKKYTTMPAAYTAMKTKFEQQGLSTSDAKIKSAKIYNYLRGKHPSMAKLSNKPDKQSKPMTNG